MYYHYQTEANAGEYDVPQCAPGTPADQCVHEITAHFKVSDMMQVSSRHLKEIYILLKLKH